LIECALDRAGVREDIFELDLSFGGGGEANAVSLTFFSKHKANDELSTVVSSDVIGQVILVNYKRPGDTDCSFSYIFEAVIAEPRIRSETFGGLSLLNNFIYKDKEFLISFKNQSRKIRGIYYCQQNGHAHVCAHASLRMIINSMMETDARLSAQAINRILGIVPPCNGLSLGDIETIINGFGGLKADIYNCQSIQDQYLSVLASIVESGDLALLVFTTGLNAEHVVPVFGHTRNSDEWHPEALPAYTGGPGAPYYPSSAWIDHFLIHDDNFGPYFTLSSRALQVDQNIKAHWIIAVRRSDPLLKPHIAEALAAVILSSILLPGTLSGSGRWFDYMTRQKRMYVLRTILIEKENYLNHVSKMIDHEGSIMEQEDITNLNALPRHFWMIEYSLPSLYTGNRSKLGEVLLSISAPNMNYNENILAVRIPSIFLLISSGSVLTYPNKIEAHTAIYQHRYQPHQW